MNKTSLLSPGNKKIKTFLIDYALYAVFIVIIIFFASRNLKFLALDNLITIVRMGSTLGIVVVGMFFVLIGAGVDISVASNMYFSAGMGVFLLNTFHVPLFWSFVVSIACGALIGTINGFFIAKVRLVPFIVTLATMSMARGFGILVSDQKIIVLDQSSFVFTSTRILGIPLVAYIFIGTAVIGHILLMYTRFGRQLFACGNNYTGAIKIGINGPRTIFLSYLICGICAGLAGMVNACNLAMINLNFAIGDEFVVISSAIIGGASLFGGKGRILPGALLGIIMIQIILNGLTLSEASPFLFQLFRGIIIFVAVMMDSIKFSGELR